MANKVIGSLNEMYAQAPVNLPQSEHPTLAQRVAQTQILNQVMAVSESIPMYSEREASRTLLQTCLSYSEEALTTVRPYQPDLVSLPQVGTDPPALRDLVDDFGRDILEDPLGNMLLSPDEWGHKIEIGDTIRPYMDPVLKTDGAAYVQFVQRLFEGGMVSFTEKPRDLITPFFVTKKSGKLRLVLDCRGVNQRFREPPSIALAAGSSWSQLEIPLGEDLFIAQSDIKDYFYSLRLPHELQPFFCLPAIPVQAIHAWGVANKDWTGASVEGLVFPAFRVVPMGWSWAMWWAQRVHQVQALIGAGLSDARLVRADRPAPDLSGGEPAVIAYADNLNVTGTDEERVQKAKDGAVARLRTLGFGVHEELDACASATSLGFSVDGATGVVKPVPDKVGLVIAAFRWLARRPRVNGRAVEKLVGHAIHFMLVRREMLCCMRSLYDFIQRSYRARRRLWPSAAREAEWIANLLPVCHANLRRVWSEVPTASDASLSGIAVCSRHAGVEQVSEIGRCKEAWRFKARDFVAPRESAIGGAEDLSLDPFSDTQSVKPHIVLPEDPFSINPDFNEVPDDFMTASEWSVAFACEMHHAEPITILEARGVVAAVRHKCRVVQNFGKKHLHLNDNLANVLCAEKGRSASYPMLRVCRRLCALVIAANCTFHHRSMKRSRSCSDPPDPLLANVTIPMLKESKLAEPSTLSARRSSIRRSIQGNSKEEKAVKRQKLAVTSAQPRFPGQTFLEQVAISQEVANDYSRRLQKFLQVAKIKNIFTMPMTKLDACLAKFLESMFLGGSDISEGNKTFAAVLDIRPGSSQMGQLPRCRRCLKGWANLDPGATRPPLSFLLVALIATNLLLRNLPEAALAILLMFSAYLRPGEALGIHANDVVRPNRSSKHFTINLHPLERYESSKVGLSDETVVIDSPALPQLGPMLGRLAKLKKGKDLFALTYPLLRAHWESALEQVGLGSQYAVMYQLRHSGPSHDRLANLRSLMEVKLRGRWGSDSSVKRYEAHGKVAGEFQKLPQEVQQAAGQAEKDLGRFANLSRACAECGFACIAVDIDYGHGCDVLRTGVLSRIFKMLDTLPIVLVWFGMPGTSWSRARKDDGGPPPLRDDGEHILGLPDLRRADQAKVARGNALLQVTTDLAHACRRRGIRSVIENPASSRAWLTPQIKHLQVSGAMFVPVDYCQYKMPWRKATLFLCEPAEWLQPVSRTCDAHFGRCSASGQRHILLQGTDATGTSYAARAQPYPRALCLAIARSLKISVL
ncbi:ANK1 [Symbiodinium natans]|uniref:ANK1 protein n=1 Tax=Symbiodinium natans TaxID=878477 RepID=A0A812SJS7_9DINO|nr:ANK1 [Symbiodinium natans]